jgi:hypothetical protein
MRTLFYAYRRKSDGCSFFHGARPYCTKAAAKNGMRQSAGIRTVNLTDEERAANPRYQHSRWRHRTKDEMDAITEQDFVLVTYELREVKS